MDQDDDERLELYQKAIYQRGLFMHRYAAIEFSLTHLLIAARNLPAYRDLGDLRFRWESKLKHLEEMLAREGPIAPHGDELRAMLAQFKEWEEQRHFLAHGLMATTDRDGERALAFRMYRHQPGTSNVQAGSFDWSLEELETFVDSVQPTSTAFTALVAKVAREITAELTQWMR